MNTDSYEEVNYQIDSFSFGASSSFFVSTSTFNEIRADIRLSSTHSLGIWGQLRGKNELPLFNVKIQLLRISFIHSHFECEWVSETSTDPTGFYFFKIPDQPSACYHLILYARNPLNNKIIIPDFNPCQDHAKGCESCQQAILNHLGHYFPQTYGYNHFHSSCSSVPIITTIYTTSLYR